MLFKSVIAAAFAALAVAQKHAPVGDVPVGNPISKPGLNEEVSKGKAYSITWAPTSTNTISILLVKGPSNNVVPIATLAEGYANSGSFSWTPATALESTGNQGYGIQIIDDVNGQYQYSTQFGLVGETTSPSAPASNPAGYPTPSPSKSKPANYPTDLPSSKKPITPSAYPTKSHGTSVLPSGTGYPSGNATIVQPSNKPSVPSTLLPTTGTATAPAQTSSSGLPEHTGAASPVKAGLGLAGIMAAAAAFL